MKKTFIAGFIFCFFCGTISFNASAQEYNYDISKYYTPDIVRNQLDLSFSTNNSFNSLSTKVDTLTTTYSTHLGGTITPNFITYTNTRQRVSQLQLNGTFSGSYDANGVLNQGNSNSNSQTSNYLNLSYTSRFYNSSNNYLLVGITSNIQVNLNNSALVINSISSKNYNNNYKLNINPTIGVGIGRIESVEDARQAIYILDDLSKRGVLTRHLQNAEIFQLSQLISRVKNKRFLDARIHLMDEISAVDSFFVSNKLLDKSGAPYFTSLYDNWQYGALYSRKSGQSFEISFSPSLNWYYTKNNSIDSLTRNMTNQNGLNGGLALTYTYEKPVKLNWQHSVIATLNGSYNTNNYKGQYFAPIYNGTTRSTVGMVNLLGNYTLGYYPSTRTYFTASISQNFQLDNFKDLSKNTINFYKLFNSNSNIQFNAYYYLSPQLRLSLGANLTNNYINYYSTSYNNLYGGFNGGISYSFF
ncbi:MAG: hypothetical protein P4L34_13110 [Paludibacter sp.]|nr:hypothetical protein [Paludibacter sp.]